MESKRPRKTYLETESNESVIGDAFVTPQPGRVYALREAAK